MEEQTIKELVNYFDRARDFRENGEFKYAIEVLDKALEVDNRNTDAMNMLGEVYSDMHDWENSINSYKKVLEIDKNNTYALGALYNGYFKIGKYRDALKTAQRALELEKNEKNYLRVITILDKFADVNALRELLKDNLPDNALLKAGIVFVNHAFAVDAEKIVEKIKNSDEKNALKALIAFNNNELQKAKEIVNKLELQNDEILNLKGIFYLEDMDFTQAIRYFTAAISIDKTVPKYFYNLANAYFYNGWCDEAIGAYKHAIELDKSNVDYRFALANLYWETSDFVKAKQEVANILNIDSTHPEAQVLNALIKYKNKDFLGAKADLDKVLKKSPDFVWAKTALVQVLADLKLWDKADKLIKTIPTDENNLKLNCAKAYLAMNKGEYEKALDLAKKILEKNEYYMQALEISMQSAFNLENLQLVQQFAQRAISADINYAKGYYFLALVRKAEKDYDEAIECFKRAIMHDLTNPEYYAQMAEVYSLKKEYKTALEYASEAISIDENSAEYKQIFQNLAAKARNICQRK